ncbi:MAG: hypothetical protein Q8R08_01045 [bacterium]|nr:hypothetical protein [bacterium]
MTKSKILVVDDVAREWAGLLTAALTMKGHTVFNTDMGQGALRIIKENPEIRAVFCNCEFLTPKLDAFELTRELRKSENGSRIRIILISDNWSQDMSSLALAAGANFHFADVNPHDIPRLVKDVEFWTRKFA